MSDFERVDAIFGDIPFENHYSGLSRRIKFELGSAAVYWASIDLTHPNPPETVKFISEELTRDVGVENARYFQGYRKRKFYDFVKVSLSMSHDGMIDESDLEDEEEVTEFKERHNLSPTSTLSYLGIYPPEPLVVSNFSFDEKGQLNKSKHKNLARFDKVMDSLESLRTNVPE